jgi:hypothetical protein
MQVWMTRYFKSLDQEEITVSVHPETGRVTGFGHTIPETRPGADIPPRAPRGRSATAFARKANCVQQSCHICTTPREPSMLLGCTFGR